MLNSNNLSDQTRRRRHLGPQGDMNLSFSLVELLLFEKRSNVLHGFVGRAGISQNALDQEFTRTTLGEAAVSHFFAACALAMIDMSGWFSS
jgi:hypothetical protein